MRYSDFANAARIAFLRVRGFAGPSLEVSADDLNHVLGGFPSRFRIFWHVVQDVVFHVCLRPIGKALNRGTGTADADITYLFRITARSDQEAHMRVLLLHSLGGQPLLLRSLRSDDVEHTDKVEIHAILTSTGRQNLLLEQIVSRLSLEPGVSGVSWEIVAEQE